MATLFVVLTIAARVFDRVSIVWLDMISLALTLATAYPLLMAQRAADDGASFN